jgi:hypothetical protein
MKRAETACCERHFLGIEVILLEGNVEEKRGEKYRFVFLMLYVPSQQHNSKTAVFYSY